LLRNDKLAIGSVIIVAFLPVLLALVFGTPLPVNAWAAVLVGIFYPCIAMFVLLRFGLVALASAYIVEDIFSNYPMTLQSSLWYSPSSYVALSIVAAIALYGFVTSTAGRPILETLASDE